MWTGLRLQQPTSDLLTVWRCDVHCLLQESEGHRLTGFLHASRMNRHLQTLALCNANTTSPPLIRIRLDIFLLQCISERTAGGHQCWIHIFVGFCLWLYNETYTCTREDWMDDKQTLHCGTFDKKTTARGRMANDEWSYCVCSETPTLFSSRKK